LGLPRVVLDDFALTALEGSLWTNSVREFRSRDIEVQRFSRFAARYGPTIYSKNSGLCQEVALACGHAQVTGARCAGNLGGAVSGRVDNHKAEPIHSRIGGICRSTTSGPP